MLHVLVVALMVGASLVTVSLTGQAQQDVDLTASDQVAASRLLTRAEPPTIFAALAPVNVPPPQARVAQGPAVIASHTAPPPPCVDDPAHPIFCVYTVQAGDTLSGIAELYRLAGNEYLSPVDMLAESNRPDVVSSDEIVPGQKLRLPRRTGIIHTAFSSSTLGQIAEQYGVSVEAIIAVPENGLSADGHIEAGQDILIPDPQQLPPAVTPDLPPLPEAAAEQATPTEQAEAPDPVEPPPVDTPEPVETEEPQPEETPDPVEEEEADEEEDEESGGESEEEEDEEPIIVSELLGDRPTQPSAYGFVWPVWGPISSYFSAGHPLGIDIDMYEDPNEPIGAAKAGIVTFAGGNACCSYGLYVIVEHGDGTSTLYAHLSQIAVSQGQQVSTGQLLGFAGATGYATGNHLHFEVRIGDQVVDPLIFLPSPP